MLLPLRITLNRSGIFHYFKNFKWQCERVTMWFNAIRNANAERKTHTQATKQRHSCVCVYIWRFIHGHCQCILCYPMWMDVFILFLSFHLSHTSINWANLAVSGNRCDVFVYIIIFSDISVARWCEVCIRQCERELMWRGVQKAKTRLKKKYQSQKWKSNNNDNHNELLCVIFVKAKTERKKNIFIFYPLCWAKFRVFKLQEYFCCFELSFSG